MCETICGICTGCNLTGSVIPEGDSWKDELIGKVILLEESTQFMIWDLSVDVLSTYPVRKGTVTQGTKIILVLMNSKCAKISTPIENENQLAEVEDDAILDDLLDTFTGYHGQSRGTGKYDICNFENQSIFRLSIPCTVNMVTKDPESLCFDSDSVCFVDRHDAASVGLYEDDLVNIFPC